MTMSLSGIAYLGAAIGFKTGGNAAMIPWAAPASQRASHNRAPSSAKTRA